MKYEYSFIGICLEINNNTKGTFLENMNIICIGNEEDRIQNTVIQYAQNNFHLTEIDLNKIKSNKPVIYHGNKKDTRWINLNRNFSPIKILFSLSKNHTKYIFGVLNNHIDSFISPNSLNFRTEGLLFYKIIHPNQELLLENFNVREKIDDFIPFAFFNKNNKDEAIKYFEEYINSFPENSFGYPNLTIIPKEKPIRYKDKFIVPYANFSVEFGIYDVKPFMILSNISFSEQGKLF